MKYGILFSIIAILLGVLVVNYNGWFLLLIWPAISYAVVATGYLYIGPAIFGKSANGKLSLLNKLVLLPYLLQLWFLWYLLRMVKKEPAYDQITENIFIGRRLLGHELPKEIDHVIDLTCEFSEPDALRSLSYYSFQILDGFVPPSEQIHCWVNNVKNLSGKIYIHCAEGHGRTGLFASLLLTHIGHSKNANEALLFIQSKRPQVRLGEKQLALLLEEQKANR
jgi:protein-tyrosine phosphatase